MGRTGVVIQARMGSTRLPGKVLRDLAGAPVLGHLLDRMSRAAVDVVMVATSDRAEDDTVAAYAARRGADVHRGPLEDVLARFTAAARAHRLDRLVRVCGDSPLLDPALVDRALGLLAASGADMASNVVERTFPPGQSVEAVTREALERARRMEPDAADREHVTRLLYRRPDAFHVVPIARRPPAPGPRLVVDTADDLERVRALVTRMDRPPAGYGLDELLRMAA
ncbi:MAG TPA: NTP transferase domain-containing protein [Miltoncostaeaceae bacterium]|nr:NTP transferase domain-containing protein [Miltoncostaeaceae bacterium]